MKGRELEEKGGYKVNKVVNQQVLPVGRKTMGNVKKKREKEKQQGLLGIRGPRKDVILRKV